MSRCYCYYILQLTLTLKMTTAQVVETSVTVNNNSPLQDYFHPDDQTQPFEKKESYCGNGKLKWPDAGQQTVYQGNVCM